MQLQSPSISSAVFAGLVLGLVASACRRDLPNHCANLAGDDTCSSRGQGQFCSGCVLDNDGCVDVLPSTECHAVSGPMDESSGSGDSGTAGSTDGSSDTEVEPSTGSTATTDGPCTVDEDCTDAAAPYCDPAGACVGCDGTEEPDAACAGTDPGNPLCVGGACVACTAEDASVCDAELLLCDEDANSCVACTEHGQCASGACELAVGRCFPADSTRLTVDGDVGSGADFASIVAAVASVPDGGYGVITVHELDMADTYLGANIEGQTIALLAASGEAPIVQGTAGNPGLRVQGPETVLYVDGLRLSGNTAGLGLDVDGATVWLDRSRIVQNAGGGLLGSSAASLTLRNCFVGGGAQDVDAIAVNSSTLDMLYTTVGGGGVLAGQARALFCGGGATASARNSILVSADPVSDVECPGVTLTTSATEADIGNLDVAWFNGYAAGDFSLSASGTSTFADIAQWRDGDPAIDIDGDARPDVDGTADFAGADVP